MSQTWTDDNFAAGHEWDTDLQNMENNFTCLKSLFSGASAPSNPVAGMAWFDTTKKLLKHRNNANGAWRGVLAGSASFKIPVYLNAAEDGWAIDSTPTDRVLAIKGGSTYTTGGSTAGTWTISGLWANDHYHGIGWDGGHVHTASGSGPFIAGGLDYGLATSGTHAHTGATGWESVNTIGCSGTWRPAACVCTLQYPDV